MKRTTLLMLLWLSGLTAGLAQQRNYWKDTATPAIGWAQRLIEPEAARIVDIDKATLEELLEAAPVEGSVTAAQSDFIFTLPTPDGGTEQFRLVNSPIMAPGLARQFPGMRTFLGKSLDDGHALARIDYTHKGFHAMVLKGSDTYYIDPFYHNYDHSAHQVYFRRDFTSEETFNCEVDHAEPIAGNTGGSSALVGEELRTYRLAVAATGEYTQFHGGTVDDAMAAIVTTMNRVNGVYETDISSRMILIDSNHLIVYTNSGSDPYSGGSGAHLGQNQTNLDTTIGNASYDVGHVFHRAGGGGVASLRSVCDDEDKARGFTSQSVPVGDPFDIDYVAHELGHQFGGNHTQNNNCNRVSSAAMEPGSASTIMGYAGICPPDLQNNSDPYFHAISQEEMIEHTIFGGGNTCATIIPTGNTPPVVEAGENGLFLPVSTPFELTGTATDLEGDSLTYCWEQFDLGPSAPPNSPQGNSPIFRSFEPTTDSTRVFPRLQDLVANTTTIGEYLPDYNRGLRFRLTVRDNHGFGTGISFDDRTFNVTEQAGPFRVLTQNTPDTWEAGSLQTVEWDVANTNVPPVAATGVDIFLSADGGFTYPYQLAAGVPNDGAALITVPDTLSGTAFRYKIKAANNVFFDINNANITIEAVTAPGLALGTENAEAEVCAGETAVYTVQAQPILGLATEVEWTVEGLPASFSVAVIDPVTLPAEVSVEVTTVNGLTTGIYPFQLIGNSGAAADTLELEISYAAQAPGAITLLAPQEGDNNTPVTPTFTWASNPDASAYDIEVAADAGFADILLAAESIADTFLTVTNPLPDSTTLFWRVRGRNSACGAGSFTIQSFETEGLRCEIFEATDVPIDLGAPGPFVTSLIEVEADAPVRDVNIVEIAGNYSPLDRIDFRLRGPNGDLQDIFVGNDCSGGFLFNFSIDDAANSEVPCPPIGGPYRPAEPLAVYNGASAAGAWRLVMFKTGQNGSLARWSIEICYGVPIMTSTRETQAAAALQVFPNPAQERVTVAFPAGAQVQGQVEVFSATGQLLKTVPIQPGDREISLSVDQYPTGLYTLGWRSRDGAMLSIQKLIIQR
ncbi:reprolysin-like metallopeptidase [Phaeodactylibacter xiamenensis]|uniref:reprolysin-like metallopeptidase n=1 Tax=Phaeodactylibacter xiamenensis TaxID=1524460 RepID=UPI0024A96E32|nr:zinc-dependent metalloprotease family protein [Phaeodactylibacter xiamenensis]